MIRILISGYYGFNNIGDESILQSVVDSLQEKLEQIEITVLSQNPDFTAQKYGVHSVNRKSIKDIILAVRKCDLLISGGGSLLQDVTSKKSIFYYLVIMWIAFFFRKKVLIYSQGIGPIISEVNRKMTACTLKHAHGIVVRDEASKELLVDIGLGEKEILVTADPVLRIKPKDRLLGAEILEQEGFGKETGKLTVGFAIKDKKTDSNFIEEICISIRQLIDRYEAQIVLIPFHYSEDMRIIEAIEGRFGNAVCCIRHKYLTNEMLGIIGNMDILVGVRLHSLIHAAIMDVPMIAISYDPKINSFMHSLDMKALCSTYDFKHEFFLEEFEKTVEQSQQIKDNIRDHLGYLIGQLDQNEELIQKIMDQKGKGM